MECGCLLEYTGEAYYQASLAEPMSCSIGAFHATYHTQQQGLWCPEAERYLLANFDPIAEA